MIAANHEIASLAQDTALRINQPSGSTGLDLEPSASFSNPSISGTVIRLPSNALPAPTERHRQRKSTCDMSPATGETTGLGILNREVV
jgi:hypothetical protein